MATAPPSGVPASLQADLPDSQPPTNQKPTVLDAVKTINPVQDLQKLPSMPCARSSLLFGIVAGASIGGLRFIFSRGGRGTLAGGNNRLGEIGAAANWAVGAWGIASLGAWETCRARQTAEATRMAALVSEIKSRQAAKAAKQRNSAANPAVGTTADSESHSTRVGAVGGIMLGDRGKEMIRERHQESPAEQANESKKDGWFGGRI
ncbi:Cox20p [Sporobolomyces koalae]|uniref:Cox20p n=1 Tax=Sporobolomyces koalae TaxID=500713 RepID=UPI00317DE2B0